MMSDQPPFSGDPTDDDLVAVRVVREAFASHVVAVDPNREFAIAAGMHTFDALHVAVLVPRATRSWRFAPVIAGIAAAAAAVTLVVNVNFSSSGSAKSSASTTTYSATSALNTAAGSITPAPQYNGPAMRSLGEYPTAGALANYSTDVVRSTTNQSTTAGVATTDAGGPPVKSVSPPCLAELAPRDPASTLALLGSATIAGRPVIVAVYVSSSPASPTTILLDATTCRALNA